MRVTVPVLRHRQLRGLLEGERLEKDIHGDQEQPESDCDPQDANGLLQDVQWQCCRQDVRRNTHRQ